MPVLREFWLWVLLLIATAIWAEQETLPVVAHHVFHAVALYCMARWIGRWWWKRVAAQRRKDRERRRIADAVFRLRGTLVPQERYETALKKLHTTTAGYTKPLWPQGKP